jgi:hypothetical protein
VEINQHPWHLRPIDEHHLAHYGAILSLHALTRAWLSELKSETPEHALARRSKLNLSTEMLQTIDFLESALEEGTHLEDWIQDQNVDEALQDLERRAFAAQSLTLQALKGEGIQELLQKISWDEGKKFAEVHWSKVISERRKDLRVGYYALESTPLFPKGSQRPLLPTRWFANECHFELLACPHRSQFAEVLVEADTLCELYSYWWGGFGFGWCEGSRMERFQTSGQRCRLEWKK